MGDPILSREATCRAIAIDGLDQELRARTVFAESPERAFEQLTPPAEPRSARASSRSAADPKPTRAGSAVASPTRQPRACAREEGENMQKQKESMKVGHEGGEASGMSDKHYNLVSILYHALKGADTYEEYIADAEQSGDQELVEFFRKVQDEERSRAERAQELLTSRLGNQAQRRAA